MDHTKLLTKITKKWIIQNYLPKLQKMDHTKLLYQNYKKMDHPKIEIKN
jgi:hypothetical protein